MVQTAGIVVQTTGIVAQATGNASRGSINISSSTISLVAHQLLLSRWMDFRSFIVEYARIAFIMSPTRHKICKSSALCDGLIKLTFCMQMKAAPRFDFHSLHPYAQMMKGKFPIPPIILLPLLYGNLVLPKIITDKDLWKGLLNNSIFPCSYPL